MSQTERSDASPDALLEWQWSPQPRAGAFLREKIAMVCAEVPAAEAMARQLRDIAGTRLEDMVDLLLLPERDVLEAEACGWRPLGKLEDGRPVYANASGQFPRIGLSDATRLYLKVESVEDFLHAQKLARPIQGAPHGGRRRALLEERFGIDEVGADSATGFGVMERHSGVAGPQAKPEHVHEALTAFRTRPRDRFEPTGKLIDAAVEAVGRSYAAHLFFRAEREYWQGRNRAGQIQKLRQDQVGIGWANHDHHTYRSSRSNFATMIGLFEKLGFHCRERFYAGLAAGWGAQVMENPDAGLVLFCDVDLSPEELRGDFAHEGLAARTELGTIGLWCGLHGDSFLEAGMHHLECTFSFDLLREQLEHEGIASMKPFTDFPHLRQAFTQGERWPVDPQRVARLLDAGSITREQAEQFRREGAVGSHLENLERNDGFKGFNQTGVSEIIAATDPRKQQVYGV